MTNQPMIFSEILPAAPPPVGPSSWTIPSWAESEPNRVATSQKKWRNGRGTAALAVGLLVALGATSSQSAELPGELLPVVRLTGKPTLDGNWDEWPALGSGAQIPLSTTLSRLGEESLSELGMDWDPQLTVRAGIFSDTFYLAARWRDATQNVIYRPWKRSGGQFKRGKNRDDMFAARFQITAGYAACMVDPTNHATDIWVWSAGRSALAGIADDQTHRISTTPLDPATEYPLGSGSVYIQKKPDEGSPGWKHTPAPRQDAEGDLLPGVAVTEETPTGSRADVRAAAQWREGYWTLELARLQQTGDPGDVVLAPGSQAVGQLAVFNAEYHLTKKITQPLLYQIAP